MFFRRRKKRVVLRDLREISREREKENKKKSVSSELYLCYGRAFKLSEDCGNI